MPRTLAGRDWSARIMGDTTAGGAGVGAMAPADYIALSANDDSPDPSDTTLTGEIGSGTLVRAQGVYAHTNGQNSYTLTHTFTSDQTVEIAKTAVFNADTDGTMVFEDLLNEPASLISGDQVAITVTVVL